MKNYWLFNHFPIIINSTIIIAISGYFDIGLRIPFCNNIPGSPATPLDDDFHIIFKTVHKYNNFSGVNTGLLYFTSNTIVFETLINKKICPAVIDSRRAG